MHNQISSRRPRILHVLGNSSFGGGSIVVLALAEMAAEMGWDVEILTTDSVFQSVLKEKGIRALPLDVIWREIRPLRDLKGLIQLCRYLRAHKYDLVHTHTSKGGFVGRLAAKGAGVSRIIHTVHGFSFHEESGNAELLAYSVLERIAAFACDTIVTVSKYHSDWAGKLKIAGKEKLVAIPNGLSPDRVKPSLGREAIRSSLNVFPDEFVMLSIGRLATQKGLEYLIEALPDVQRDISFPFRLILAGSGPIEAELKTMAKDLGVERQVQFVGFRSDIGDLLAACDTVILPSLHEGLSISLLEAMAAARPIIATAIGSNIEVTNGGVAAKLVTPKSSVELASAIVELATDSGLRQDFANKAFDTFEAAYTEDHMLEAYRQLYIGHIACNESNASRSGWSTLGDSIPGGIGLVKPSRGDEAR